MKNNSGNMKKRKTPEVHINEISQRPVRPYRDVASVIDHLMRESVTLAENDILHRVSAKPSL